MLIYQEGHEEAQEELSKKVKFFFSTAVQNWDADFYIKVDDNIDIDLGRTSSLFICIEYHNFLAFGLFLFIHWNSNISSTPFSTWQRGWLDFLNIDMAKIVLILDAWSQGKWLLKSMYFLYLSSLFSVYSRWISTYTYMLLLYTFSQFLQLLIPSAIFSKKKKLHRS